ncbi:MAG: SIS domain-containing protein [Clostridiales bacterium]|nr:SIS domain-containing protein [Clostridiales bacterium]
MVSMLDCIRRVPERMREMLARRADVIAPLEARYGNAVGSWNELVFLGCGTSNTAGVTARFPAQKLSGVRVTPVLPSEFLHDQAVRNPNALYVFISQTGTSALTREALALAKQLGYATVAISEAADTPISREADAYLYMGCGQEEYPMRTIGYSTSVLSLMLLGLWVGERTGATTPGGREAFLRDALLAADQILPVVEQTRQWLEKERRPMLRSDCLLFTGSGALYGVALEAAVKQWETPQIVTLACELEEGLHGPNFGYTQRHCVLVLNDGGVDNDKARSLASYMKNEHHNGYLIGAGTLDAHDLPFACDGSVRCLVFAAVVQTIAYSLAVAQGRDLYEPHDNSVMNRYFDTHRAANPSQS